MHTFDYGIRSDCKKCILLPVRSDPTVKAAYFWLRNRSECKKRIPLAQEGRISELPRRNGNFGPRNGGDPTGSQKVARQLIKQYTAEASGRPPPETGKLAGASPGGLDCKNWHICWMFGHTFGTFVSDMEKAIVLFCNFWSYF